jgi:hypothetical protein
MDANTWIALAALGVAIIVAAERMFGKSLTRYEHQEFQKAVYRELDDVKKWLRMLFSGKAPPD